MNYNKLAELTISALAKVEAYIENYSEESAGINTRKVLLLLKNDFEKRYTNERVLRGFKDICTSIAIHNESASFAEEIFALNEFLAKELPKFKKLELLRSDFGKGNPI